MDKKNLIIGLIVVIILGLIIGYAIFNQEGTNRDSNNNNINIYPTTNNNSGLRICPDYWADNQEPPFSPIPEERQYFIIDEERRELSEFDVNWIKNNCEVNKPEISV